MDSIEVLPGDCKELLDCVTPDVLITDPPYSEHVHKSAVSCGTPGARATLAARGAAPRDLGFAHLSDGLRSYIAALAARTKRWSVIFTDTESVGDWKHEIERAGAAYIRAIPWVRWSMPQLSGDRPPQGHEMIVLAWGSEKGKKSWNGPGNLTHFAHTCMRGSNKHKAQKPLDLMLDLVDYFSNQYDLIVDPCVGSGTTALAAAALGRNFLGCEKDLVWCEKARVRLAGDSSWYDDTERFNKYVLSLQKRKEEMNRMAANTARIVANRERLKST